MDPSTGQSLMRWTVRLAVALIVGRAMLRLWAGDRRPVPSSAECVLWTLGCIAYACHVALAFEFVHDWSHDQAWRHTAAETARMTGVQRGEGLWVNYLFTILWTVDVVRLCRARRRHHRTSNRVDAMMALFFAFMVFNSTVVFGPSHYRWLAMPVCVVLLVAWRRGRNRRAGEKMETSRG